IEEYEILRVRPIIRDLPCIVVAHDRTGARAGAARRVVLVETSALPVRRLADEAVHLAAVDIVRGCRVAVRTAAVDVRGVVVRLHARVRLGIWHTDRELTVSPRN